MKKEEVSIYSARFDYFSLLRGGLKEWLITDEDEKKKMQKLLKAIEDYRKFIVDAIEESYQEELIKRDN